MQSFLRLAIGFLLGGGLLFAQPQPAAEWKMLLDSAGMKVFLLDDVANQEIACKVVTELSCSVPEAIAFFRDFGNYPKWVTVYETAVPLRQAHEDEVYGYITYRPESSPIPGKRVDAAIRLIIEQAGNSWIGNFAAVAGEVPEKEGFIRQPYFNVNWAIVKRDNSICAFTYNAKISRVGIIAGYTPEMYAKNNYDNILALRKIFATNGH